MTTSLLVLTDFMPPATHALNYAAALAGPLGAPMVVLHVHRDSLLDPERFNGRQPRRSPEAVALALDCLTEQLPVPVVTEVQHGQLVDEVQRAARQHRPTVLVLGRTEAADLPDELLATTAVELLRATPQPMLVVPLHAPAARPRRVLIAADAESIESGESISIACALLRLLHARPTLLHVRADTTAPDGRAAYAAVVRAGLVPDETALATRTLAHPDPAEAILTQAASGEFDLVLLIARRRSLLGQLFHRSVTAQVLLHSSLPVLVVPAG